MTGNYAGHHALFKRLIVLPGPKILLCVPEKDASTSVHAMAHVANGKRPGKKLPADEFWWGLTPHRANMSAKDIRNALQSTSWRSAVVWRDPVERFLSAYVSKCLSGDHDGPRHCQRYLGFRNDSKPTIADVISALKERHEPVCDWDAHWAPQACFCGGLGSDFAELYSHRIHVSTLQSGISQLLEHRVPPPRLRDALAELSNGTVSPLEKQQRRPSFSAPTTELRLELGHRVVQRELRDMYARDYYVLDAARLRRLGVRMRSAARSGDAARRRLGTNEPPSSPHHYRYAGV